MTCRLIDLAPVILWLLMFKACENFGISKIEFLNFSGTEKIKQNKKKTKKHLKPSKPVNESLLKQFQQKSNIFLVLH